MSLSNDIYGRTITVATSGGSDVYTVINSDSSTFNISFPTGTLIGIVYAAINAQAPGGYVAVNLLSQTMTNQQFGQYIIQMAQQSAITRSLSPSQRLTMATTLLPYSFMIESGDLSGFLSVIGTIPVDGVIITSAVITQMTNTINGFLNGSI